MLHQRKESFVGRFARAGNPGNLSDFSLEHISDICFGDFGIGINNE